MSATLSPQEAFKAYSWYHCIDIGGGLETPGQKIILQIQKPIMAEVRKQDLRGKRFLDIGCRDGMFSFEAEKMGAADILGIDNDLSSGAVEFLIPYLKSKVRMQSANIYDFSVPSGQRFDCVLFAGVLYHLRLPFLGLKRVADTVKTGGTLILETAMMATKDKNGMLYCPAPKDSPYEPTSVTFYNDEGLRAALSSMGFGEVECRHVLSDDGNTHSSWEAFEASETYWKDGGMNPAYPKPNIARAVYVAKKTTAEDNYLSAYWYGSHTLNSAHDDNHKFLNEHNVAGLAAPPES